MFGLGPEYLIPGSVVLAVVLWLLTPLRDSFYRTIGIALAWPFKKIWNFLEYLWVAFRALPRYLSIRDYVRRNNPLWGFRPFNAINKNNIPPSIMVMNFKGGVGKTTIAANLAASFSKGSDFRVLLIDLDYQGSLSDLLVKADPKTGPPNQVGNWISSTKLPEANELSPVTVAGLPNVELITANYELTGVEDNQLLRWLLKDNTGGDVRSRIARWLSSLHFHQNHKFDLILFDAPPRLSLASVNALRIADYIIIPSKLEPLSSSPVFRMNRYLMELKGRIGGQFSILGAVFNMTRSEHYSSTEEEYYSEVESAILEFSEQSVVFNTFIANLTDIGRPDRAQIGYLQPGQKGDRVRAIFDDLVEEIQTRIEVVSGKRLTKTGELK